MSRTDLEIHEYIQQNNAEADAACHGKPVMLRTRTALLELERRAHATGWDGPDAPPRLFVLERNPKTGSIGVAWANLWNEILPRMMESADGNLSTCLTFLAQQAEAERRAAFGDLSGIPTSLFSDPDAMRELREVQARAQRGEDLHRARTRGFEVYGYGVRFEGWGAWVPTDDPAYAPVWEAFRQRKLKSRPERIETRQINAFTRDNHQWLVTRYRGFRPLTRVFKGGDPKQHVGGVVNALSRVVAATLTSPVTIIPTDITADQEPFRS